jgi:ATP-binding cassette subfamily B multidrug efflux pump
MSKKSNLQLLKLLSPYFKPHLGKLVLAFALLPIASATFAAQPFILQKAIDEALKDFDLNKLYFFVGMLVLAVLFNFFSQILQFWIINLVGQNSVADLRQNLFSHLQRMPMTYFDKTPVGRNVSRVTSDVEQLAESFAGGLILVILDVFNIIAILCFMFYLNWKLSFAVAFFLIPIYLLSIYYQSIFRKANLEARAKLSELNSFLQQNVVGINVVHALNSAKKSMDKFAKSNSDYFKANDISIKADSQLSALIELISLLALLTMIFISSMILKNDFITIGTVLAFLQYTQSLFEPIRNLSDRFTIIQSAFTAAERVDQLLIQKEEIDEGILEKTFNEEPLFRGEEISFRYSRPLDLKLSSSEEVFTDWVLKDFSFAFEKGKKYALVGRTGSGKSTIIKLLTRLYEIEEGKLFFTEQEIASFKKSFLRSKIAVIHQDSYIFAGTLRENIILNRDEKDLDWDFIQPLLDLISIELNAELSERATNISSGEAQVINFARALISKPEIIVLDEATAKIDIKTEKVLQKFLEDYFDNSLSKTTAVIIAHRLETIKTCDEILFLKNGSVIEKGSHQELLLKKGEYESYHEILSLNN